ncbi:MAG: lysylphosphatidylglycerol synthase domain-containing protein, partial [Myxococcota bacterium]|nr:lysylphosphatidylglycerol synthase domain-containing protein [Myxococcota bacterium]
MKILLEIVIVALAALTVARLAAEPWRGRLMNLLKGYLTVRMVWVLLEWPVESQAGATIPAWQLVLDVLRDIDAGTFWTFAAIGALIRFSGVVASMLRWQLVLLGQRIELPFRHIFGAFLIGRAIGFFLPSTAGLDAYKLYDAARFSGRTVEVTAGTVLEKVLGVTGIFLTFLVALPFGMSIFGESAGKVAAITVPMSVGVIGGLLTVLWYPRIVQWGIENLPLPGKARLQGVVMRISNATAAYRDKKTLVLAMLFLSFAVHFTTAAMYYFMAIAVGAGEYAAFWPIVFGSAIQIFATVIGPTIGGLGVREAAQLLTVGALIGPGAAIVSATLGFWVGEVPTLFGFGFWMARGRNYRPEYCRVDGQQVDYEEAAKAARALETDEERARRLATPKTPAPPYVSRAASAACYGLGGGVLGGILLGLAEALAVAAGGFGTEAQVLWYGPLAYAAVFGALGLAGGVVLAVLPMDRAEIRGWTPALAMLATAVPVGLAVTVFRLRRDVYLEQMPPLPVLLAVLAGFGVLALLLFLVAPRILRGRAGLVARPRVALALLAFVVAGGFVAARTLPLAPTERASVPAVPAALRDAPNLILIMVDTLRADHLSCYGAEDVRTP